MTAPTREQVTEWAREAATKVVDHDFTGKPITDADVMLMSAYGHLVERIAALAYAAGQVAEREACAKLCDMRAGPIENDRYAVLCSASAAIRARSTP